MYKIPRGANEVAAFARRMVATLCIPKNASKPGWKDTTLHELREKLQEESKELYFEIDELLVKHKANTIGEKEQYQVLWDRIAEEATDLANVCMMITDRVGGLNE